MESTLKHSGQQTEQVEQIVSYLVTNKPISFEECIVWARLQFEDKYSNSIRQLLYSLPKDAVTNTGQPFWSGPKRAPDPLTFNSNDVGAFLSNRTRNVVLRYSSLFTSIISLLLLTFMRSTTGSEERLTQHSLKRSRTQSLCLNSHPRVGSKYRSMITILHLQRTITPVCQEFTIAL